MVTLGHPAGYGRHLLPGHPEALGHQVFDDAGMALRQGDHPWVEGLAVQGPPGPVGAGLCPVETDDMVVKLRITQPRFDS